LSWIGLPNSFACIPCCNSFQLQDEDFVADKDDSGSPSDDSEEEGSDASLSGGEKEVTEFTLSASLRELFLSQKICSKALF
jgi:structure-specific recognition protein 1